MNEQEALAILLTGRNRSTCRRICPRANLSTKNPTWTTLGPNLILRCEAMFAYDGYSGEDNEKSDNDVSGYEICLIYLIQNNV